MKIAKFAIVGTMITTLAYGLYVLLIQIGIHYQLALALDYVFGISTGYILNRYWTFYSHGKPRLSFMKYLVTYIGIYFGNVALLGGIVGLTSLGPVLGQLIALGVVTLLSYLAQNNWVFRAA